MFKNRPAYKLVCLLIFGLLFIAKASAQDTLTGTIAVVNKSDNSISIIDVTSKQIVATLPTGEGPHELVASNDHRYVVSTNFVGGDSLTVFDVSMRKVLRTIDLKNYPGPHGIRFLKDNKNVLFTSGKSQAVGLANVETGKVTGSILTSQQTTHMLAIDEGDVKSANTVIYTTNIRSNSISVLYLASQKLVKNIQVEAMPEAINFRHSSGELWYGANKEGKVIVIDPKSEEVLASWGGFSFPYRVLFNHDESIAMVPDFREHFVRFIDAESKQPIGTLTLETEAGPQGISFIKS